MNINISNQLVNNSLKERKLEESKGILIRKHLNSFSRVKNNSVNQNQNGEITKRKSLKKVTFNNGKGKKEKIINGNYDDYELNNLDYVEAIEKDFRKFFRVYWSLLKREHLFIFTYQ